MLKVSIRNIVRNTDVKSFLIAKKHIDKPHKKKIIIVLALSLPK